MCFYHGKSGDFQKNCQHYWKNKGGVDGAKPKKFPDSKNTSAITASEEELLLICEQNGVNLVGEESIWVVDSGASFDLTPKKEGFSLYTVGDHGYV